MRLGKHIGIYSSDFALTSWYASTIIAFIEKRFWLSCRILLHSQSLANINQNVCIFPQAPKSWKTLIQDFLWCWLQSKRENEGGTLVLLFSQNLLEKSSESASRCLLVFSDNARFSNLHIPIWQNGQIYIFQFVNCLLFSYSNLSQVNSTSTFSSCNPLALI